MITPASLLLKPPCCNAQVLQTETGGFELGHNDSFANGLALANGLQRRGCFLEGKAL